MDQIENTWPGCWVEQVKIICEKYNIDINVNIITKQKLKEVLKKRINATLNEELTNIKTQKTKVRFLSEFSQKEYLKELELKKSITLMKIRLNMIEVK